MSNFLNPNMFSSMAQYGPTQPTGFGMPESPSMTEGFLPQTTPQIGYTPENGAAPWGSSFLPAMGAQTANAPGGFFSSMLGTKEAPGWGGMAMGAAGGLFNAWMGMKQYGLAKDTLETNKQQFAQNFDAQRRTTNTRLEDRQNARVASNPGAYQSVGSYMNQNGIK